MLNSSLLLGIRESIVLLIATFMNHRKTLRKTDLTQGKARFSF